MKKTVLFTWTCLFVIAITIFWAKGKELEDNNDKDLENYTLAQCVTFLQEHDVMIPTEDGNWNEFAYSVFQMVVDNPNIRFTFEAPELYSFASQIKTAVCSEISQENKTIISRSAEELVYSTKYLFWASSTEFFNCYAYVLSNNEYAEDFIKPGYYSGISLSLSNYTIDQIAYAACKDLQSEALGYKCAYYISTEPTLQSGQYAICVRKGTTPYSGGFYDYHFMRLKSNGFWYHKPGATNIIKFNGDPGDMSWTDEGIYDYEDIYSPITYYYDSPIKYIVVSGVGSHVFVSTNDGTTYCQRCGMIAPEDGLGIGGDINE